MSAADYRVTFGYKAQDGVYYGPSGSVGLYHRGNDRACPTGVPIVINGLTIGLTGATGLVSGPHLHTQAMIGSADTNPAPYEFKGGKVVTAGWHSQFGNHIRIDVGGVVMIYAHLSKINVSVGQVIGGDEVITSNDIQLVRNVNKWFEGYDVASVDSGATDGAEMGAWTGQTWVKFLNQKSAQSGPYQKKVADALKAVSVLQTEVATLKTQLAALQASVADLTKVVGIKDTEITRINGELKSATDKLAAQSGDTELLNGFGQWLTKLIARLGLKG